MSRRFTAVLSAVALVAVFAGAPLALALPAPAPMAMDGMPADCHSHGDDAGVPASTAGHGGMAACCGVSCQGFAEDPVVLLPVFFGAVTLVIGYSFFVPPARAVVFYRPPKN